MVWKAVQDDGFLLKLLAGVLLLLATVFFFGLFLGRRCVAYTPEVVSEDQDTVSFTKSTKAQPVPGMGILLMNFWLVVLETAAAVSSTTETMESYLAQKVMLVRYTVTELSLLCGQTKLSPGRAIRR